jgi:rod shape-determining protein MreC
MTLEGTKDFLSSIGQLKKENEKLLGENQSLVSENAYLHDLENENKMLREQLNILPRDQYNLVASSVVSQDPNGLGNWMEIDRGKKDGIAEGMAVIVSKGVLIGRVQEVSEDSARVILLTNPKSTVNVATVESGAKGVVKGEYGLGMIFDMILQTDSVQTGNNVITSGIGGEIPRGLYVGSVQEVHPSDDHLFQQATVISPIQSSKLQMVFVIKSEK